MLDLCCGPGFVTKVIREKIGSQGRIIGIDYSSDFIDYAKKLCHFKNVSFVYGNVENLDRYIDNQKFDVVICLASWSWIKYKDKLISKIKKVLNPEGKFVLSLSSDNPYHAPTFEFSQRFRKNLKLVIASRGVDPSYLDKIKDKNKRYVKSCTSLFKKSGFKLIAINEVKGQLTLKNKLFLYKNPARTEWVGSFKPEDRYLILKEALCKTSDEIESDIIERHTYYIVLQLEKGEK